MAIRSTMVSLIGRVRSTIADPASSSQVFSDQEIQDLLDRRRVDVYNAVLRPTPTLVVGGTFQWLDFYSDLTDWEDNVVLRDRTFAVLAPSTTDNLIGHWQFPATNSPGNMGQLPPVFISGMTYDVYGTAADLLDAWLPKIMLDFDFGMGRGDSFSRSQKSQMVREMRDDFRSRQRLGTIQMRRDDMDHSWPNFNPTGV